jgi:hypothetical protein
MKGDACPEATSSDLDQVIALDRALFGADRGALWRRLHAEQNPILIARGPAHSDGVAGYLCVQDQALGPWGAVTPAVAETLLAAALRRAGASGRLRVSVPHDNEGARTLLQAHGFNAVRSVRHMRRGSAAIPSWRHLYGKASYCLG